MNRNRVSGWRLAPSTAMLTIFLFGCSSATDWLSRDDDSPLPPPLEANADGVVPDNTGRYKGEKDAEAKASEEAEDEAEDETKAGGSVEAEPEKDAEKPAAPQRQLVSGLVSDQEKAKHSDEELRGGRVAPIAPPRPAPPAPPEAKADPNKSGAKQSPKQTRDTGESAPPAMPQGKVTGAPLSSGATGSADGKNETSAAPPSPPVPPAPIARSPLSQSKPAPAPQAVLRAPSPVTSIPPRPQPQQQLQQVPVGAVAALQPTPPPGYVRPQAPAINSLIPQNNTSPARLAPQGAPGASTAGIPAPVPLSPAAGSPPSSFPSTSFQPSRAQPLPPDLLAALPPGIASRYQETQGTMVIGAAGGAAGGRAGPIGGAFAIIPFASGSTRLSDADLRKIAAAADMYRVRSGRIRVVGHASGGTSSRAANEQMIANWEISQARANVVADALISRGVPAGEVLIEAVGDGQSAGESEAAGRRVDIFLE